MNALEAFDQLKNCFPKAIDWRGEHLLNYAERNGVWLIERKKQGCFFYLISTSDGFQCIHTSMESRFKRLRTVGDSFTPSVQ